MRYQGVFWRKAGLQVDRDAQIAWLPRGVVNDVISSKAREEILEVFRRGAAKAYVASR